MLGPLPYLLLTRFKNQIKSILKSPAKLIYTIILLVIIGVTIVSGNLGSLENPNGVHPLMELYALCFAFYFVMFVLIARNGFNNGASLFTLPDVNLIFPAPLSSTIVLFYGLFKQLGTSLLLGVFLFFQYSWLHNLYGIRYRVIVFILIGYALTLFCAQLLAMILYSFTNGNVPAKRKAKIAFYAILGVFAVALALFVMPDKSQMIPRAVEFLNFKWVSLFPVIGWVTMLASGLIAANIAKILIGLCLLAAYIIAIILLIVYSKREYYEDVLNTAEISYSAITAKKEGKIGEAVPQNVKLGKVGIEKGFGADAFYYKHLIENRRSRLFLINRISLVFGVMVVLFSLFLRNEGIMPIFMFASYMQLFSVSLGRMTKELLKPYVYLVPEPAFKKLLYCLKESLSGFVVEAIVIFVPVAFIIHMSILDTLFCILARVSFSILFTAGNILVERVFGSMTSKVFVFIFYFIVLLIMALPGIIVAIVLSVFGVVIISGSITIFFAVILCNIPIALFVVFLCRNMLEYAELNYQ